MVICPGCNPFSPNISWCRAPCDPLKNGYTVLILTRRKLNSLLIFACCILFAPTDETLVCISALCQADETNKKTPSSVPQGEVWVNMYVLARRREITWQRGQIKEVQTKGKNKNKSMQQAPCKIQLNTFDRSFYLLRGILLCSCVIVRSIYVISVCRWIFVNWN